VAPRRWECHVAVVDDDEAVRRALSRLVRSLGFEAEAFASGEDFLAALEGRPPDCVVLDLHMPKIDGFEVQARLARSGLPVPVVVITGHDSPEAQARAMRGGAAAYLCKPLDERTLMEAIQCAVGGPSRSGNRASWRRS
jgi:FixJ family two-component response regulator